MHLPKLPSYLAWLEIIIPFWQMEKLRLTGIEQLAQGHIAKK